MFIKFYLIFKFLKNYSLIIVKFISLQQNTKTKMQIKNTVILFLFFACILVRLSNGSNILRFSDFNEAIFSLWKKNKRHVRTPYNIFNVTSTYECADACLYDTSCKSFNLNVGVMCELVDQDRNNDNSYNDAENVDHYDTGTIKIYTLFYCIIWQFTLLSHIYSIV